METLQRTANRGSISTATSFDIDNSCKFAKGNSETMYRQQVNGDRRTWTSSFWIKFCGGTGSGTDTHMLYHGVYGQGTRMFTSGGTDQLYIDLCSTGDERYRWITNRVFRDRSAWYHIVWRVDTTQSSLSDRMRLYVNGEQITSWQKEADDADSDNVNNGNKMPQNYQTLANYDHGGYDKMQFSYKEASIYADMYIAEFHHCDGYSYAPTEFGESDSDTGIWKPIEPSVSYGNSGCHLDFEDSSNMGNDVNGGTDFTLQNISAADQATDTPTNNFCILNTNHVGNYYKLPTDGGTYMPMNGVNQDAAYAGTIGVTQGKWYYETYIDMRSSTYGLTVFVGYHTFQGNYDANAYYSSSNQESFVGYKMHAGTSYSWDSGSRVLDTNPAGLGTSQVGQFVGVALNLDDNQISFYVNGSAISNATNLPLNDLGDETDTGIFALPAISVYDNNHTVNFGGYTKATISSAQSDANGYGTFEHAPPSGYYALCSKNLAEFG
jgi:hypothetical protein